MSHFCAILTLLRQIYHEASVCNFLEVLLYHRTACEAADDSLVELIDYAYRKFVRLIEQCEKLPSGGSVMPDKKLDAKEFLKQTP